MGKGFRGAPFFKRLPEFVEENNGSLSATRLAFLMWVAGVLIVWIFDSISKKMLQPVPPEVTTIIGILMTGKVIQKFGEGDADADTGEGQPNDKKNT